MRRINIYKGNLNVLSAKITLKDNEVVIEERHVVKEKDAEFYRHANIFLTLKGDQKVEDIDEAKGQYLTDIKDLDLDQLKIKLKNIETEEDQKVFDDMILRRTANTYSDFKRIKLDRTISKEEFKTLKKQYKKQNAPQQK